MWMYNSIANHNYIYPNFKIYNFHHFIYLFIYYKIYNQTRKFKNDGVLNDGNVNPIICKILCI